MPTHDAASGRAGVAESSTGRKDRGNSLPEVLVAMALMGIAVSVVIGGLRTTIQASTTSDEQAKTEAVLTSASDRLSASDYIPCPGDDYGDYAFFVSAAATAVGWDGDQVAIIDLAYWDSTAGSSVDADGDPIEADGDWSATNSLTTDVECNPDISLTTSRTLQRFTIQVTSRTGKIVRTIEVVKSPIVADPSAA